MTLTWRNYLLEGTPSEIKEFLDLIEEVKIESSTNINDLIKDITETKEK